MKQASKVVEFDKRKKEGRNVWSHSFIFRATGQMWKYEKSEKGSGDVLGYRKSDQFLGYSNFDIKKSGSVK